MNSNAALKIPRVPKKRKACKADRGRAGRKRKAERKIQRKFKEQTIHGETHGPKKNSKASRGNCSRQTNKHESLILAQDERWRRA